MVGISSFNIKTNDISEKSSRISMVNRKSNSTIEDTYSESKFLRNELSILDFKKYMIKNENIDLDNFENLETDVLREELLKFSGVGNKVADCIMLFSYKRGEVFPVDVWIKRVMEELFIKEETPVKKISKEAEKYRKEEYE